MKPTGKIIIYDNTCPLCAAYTNAFVQTGLLSENERTTFDSVDSKTFSLIDTNRAVNEIPLVDAATKQVWYGIDALLELLGTKLPLVKKTGSIKPVKWFLYKLYKLVSYNRRVIVACEQPANSFDCAPDFNTRYRILFMALCLLFNTWMLLPLHRYVLQQSIFNSTGINTLQYAHTAVVTGNILIAVILGRKNGLTYLGQVNMIALTTILLTIPLILVAKNIPLRLSLVNNLYLGGLLLFIIKEYIRRMKFAGIIHQRCWIVFANASCITGLLFYLIYHQ